MSTKDPLKGIRDGRMRNLAKVARRQKFTLQRTKHDHLGLICPTCGDRTTLSKTVGGGDQRAFPDVLKRLRLHGLEFEGRPGEHTAEPTPT